MRNKESHQRQYDSGIGGTSGSPKHQAVQGSSYGDQHLQFQQQTTGIYNPQPDYGRQQSTGWDPTYAVHQDQGVNQQYSDYHSGQTLNQTPAQHPQGDNQQYSNYGYFPSTGSDYGSNQDLWDIVNQKIQPSEFHDHENNDKGKGPAHK